jgi:hypothetical protein
MLAVLVLPVQREFQAGVGGCSSSKYADCLVGAYELGARLCVLCLFFVC